ncbi:unnamed protein product [Blepharisma stoltei]|uniref:Uncharacterized protein n=1 Tax=Blepharisma stoltei TaxID=1481888 RepID=A0AAU9IUF2_9CILI|nr:unnamed protein product [Blepharisma stoltei]
MAFSLQVRKLNRGIAKYHKDLLQLINKAQPDGDSDPKRVFIDLSTYEEMTKITSKLFEKDCLLSNLYRKQSIYKSQAEIISQLRKELKDLNFLVQSNSKRISRDLKRVGMILKEYKERCKEDFVMFLKTLDADLRKALQPLVPNQVLIEQIKYKPVNESLAGTLKSSQKNENELAPMESEVEGADKTVEMLNNHIQLLVNTLEGVAKTLISITQGTDRKYYELVDSKELQTEPPSPLAAPLPDYFSFDVVNLSEEHREFNYIPNPMILEETTKKKIIKKFEDIQKSPSEALTPRKGERLKVKLEKLLNKQAKEADILDLFKEEGIPISMREEMVFEIINSTRGDDSSTNANEILEVADVGFLRDLNSIKRTNVFEVSGKNYSKELKIIQGKDLTDKFDDTLADFGSLDSSIDEKMVRPTPIKTKQRSSKFNFSRKASESLVKFLPPVSIKAKAEQKELRPKKSVKDIRIRSITPGKQPNDDKKIPAKRSKTPVVKKKK